MTETRHRIPAKGKQLVEVGMTLLVDPRKIRLQTLVYPDILVGMAVQEVVRRFERIEGTVIRRVEEDPSKVPYPVQGATMHYFIVQLELPEYEAENVAEYYVRWENLPDPTGSRVDFLFVTGQRDPTDG